MIFVTNIRFLLYIINHFFEKFKTNFRIIISNSKLPLFVCINKRCFIIKNLLYEYIHFKLITKYNIKLKICKTLIFINELIYFIYIYASLSNAYI